MSYSQVTSQSGARKVNMPKEENSIGSIISDLKELFASINIPKLSYVVRNTLLNVKKCTDGTSKITCLIEGIVEYFD